MEQRCSLVNVYLNWLAYAAGAVVLAVTGRYLMLAVWIVAAPLFQIAYLRLFPRMSRMLGYGSVEDVAPKETAPARVEVTLYTAAGCPFCPILEERLETLRQSMGFQLSTVDVTLRPDLLSRFKIKAVPVVSVGGTMRTGNLTSRELADLISGASAATIPA